MASLDRRHFLGAAAASLAGAAGVRLVGKPSDLEPATATATATPGWHHPRRDAGNTAATTDPGPGADGDVGWETRIRPADSGADALDGFATWNGTLLVPSTRELVGLDAATGDRRWTYSPEDGHWSVESSPRVRDSTVFLAVGGIYVSAVSLETRRPRWRYRTNGSVGAMTLAGNALCFSGFDDGRTTTALDTETGRTRWRRSDWWYDAGAAGDRLVAVRRQPGTVPLKLELAAIDLGTGETEWTRELGDISLSLGSSVVCLEDRAVVTGFHGATVLDAATGDVRAILGGVTATGSVAVDADADRLYATDPSDAVVTSVSLDGRIEWTVETAVGSGIAVGGETVYATTPDGLLALDAADGDRLFTVTPTGGSQSHSATRFETTPLIAEDAVYHGLGDTVYEVSGA